MQCAIVHVAELRDGGMREKGKSGDNGQVFINIANILAKSIKLQQSRVLQ